MTSKTEAQTPELVVGEPCPCCGVKVRGPKLTEEEKREKRRAYNKARAEKRKAEQAELQALRERLEQEKLAR